MSNVSKPLHAYYKSDGSDLLPDGLQCHAEEFKLLQHRILTRRWLRYTDRSGDYTILKREFINDELTRPIASKLLKWGKDSGVVQCDGHYIQNEKSYGYRLREDLEQLPTRRTPLTNNKLVSRIRSFEHRDSRHYTIAHRHLKKWLKHLSVSPDAMNTALRCSETDAAKEANRGAVQLLLDGQFSFGVCDYGRCHTNVTRLFRPIRRHLYLNGSPLVNIDIANSQPLFVGVAILQRLSMASAPLLPCRPPEPPQDHTSPIRWRNRLFWDHNQLIKQGVISDSKMPQMVFQNGTQFDTQLNDIWTYLNTCENGGLYRQVMDGIGWTKSKDEFKNQVWFHFLYGSNKSSGRLAQFDDSGLRHLNEFFQKTWPSVYDHIWSMKKNNYKQFSRDMQRAESKVMIDSVGSRLAAEYPHIPILTIHDSYLTTPEHVDTVKRLIEEEFATLGITPTLGVENYAERNEYDCESYEAEEATGEDCRLR